MNNIFMQALFVLLLLFKKFQKNITLSMHILVIKTFYKNKLQPNISKI